MRSHFVSGGAIASMSIEALTNGIRGYRNVRVREAFSKSSVPGLMVNYYKRLMNNTGRSDALRQTQLEMLQSEIYQHPYYWAPFIPSGDWTAMEF